MDVTTRYQGNIAVIGVKGRFDFSGHRIFREAVKAATANADVKEIQIDFSETDYIDSSALGMLLLSRENASNLHKTVVLVQPAGSVKQVLEIANFQKLFAFK